MKVALAQINPTVGALKNNTRKIKGVIEEYSSQCDIIIFPEMVLSGYPPQDLLLDYSFIQKIEGILEELAAESGKTPIIIGTVRLEDGKFFNSAAVLQDGRILAYRDKAHLPTYDVFDEDRYFTSAESIKPIELNIQGQEFNRTISFSNSTVSFASPEPLEIDPHGIVSVFRFLSSCPEPTAAPLRGCIVSMPRGTTRESKFEVGPSSGCICNIS